MRSKVVRLSALILILAVVLYPLFWMIGTSVKSPEEIASNIGLIPHNFTPSNFSEGWNKFDVAFGRFFLNSAMVATLTVLGNTVSCLLAAYALGRLRFRLRGLWFAIMIGTLLLPGHVLIIPQYILFRTLGLVGGDFPYLPLLVPHFLATEAFFVFLMVQFMRGIPRELDEAAVIDGANPYGIFRHVILPLSRPALVTTAIFSFIWTWNDFFKQLKMVGGEFPYLPLVVPHFLATEAFFVFLMVQFMRGIPRELDEAAVIDGASPFSVFRHVVLPLSRPALVTTAIFSFIWTWNDFFRQLVYLSQLKDYTAPVALTLFIDSTSESSVGPMFAMSLLSLVPVFLFFVAFQRMLVEGINTSGLKG